MDIRYKELQFYKLKDFGLETVKARHISLLR